MQPRISVVTLAVPDVDRSVDFYRRAFGWEPSLVVEEEVAFYDLNGIVFSLWSGMSAELGRRGELPPSAVALAHNVDSPDEVDRVIDQAVDQGATVAAVAQHQPWGGYSGYLADPEGHLWEIAYNPDWPLDEEGRVRPPW